MTGVGVAGRGGPVSLGFFPRAAVRQVSPVAPRPREGQRDHPCAGVTMSAVATIASDGCQADARSCELSALRTRMLMRWLACSFVVLGLGRSSAEISYIQLSHAFCG